MDEYVECKVVRPGTLGYQQCYISRGHIGPHQSQDRVTWSDEHPVREQPETDGLIAANLMANKIIGAEGPRLVRVILDAYLNPEETLRELGLE